MKKTWEKESVCDCPYWFPWESLQAEAQGTESGVGLECSLRWEDLSDRPGKQRH